MKPVVYYSEIMFGGVGRSSWLRIASTHPLLGDCADYGGGVNTSSVVAYDKESGDLETLNTMYKLKKEGT